LVDEIVRQQGLHERAAAVDEDVLTWLLLWVGDGFYDIALEERCVPLEWLLSTSLEKSWSVYYFAISSFQHGTVQPRCSYSPAGPGLRSHRPVTGTPLRRSFSLH